MLSVDPLREKNRESTEGRKRERDYDDLMRRSSEPCHEAETVELLREVKQRADEADLAWLQKHAKVYQAG